MAPSPLAGRPRGLLLEDPRLREASAQNLAAILERTCWRLAARTRTNAERQPGLW